MSRIESKSKPQSAPVAGPPRWARAPGSGSLFWLYLLVALPVLTDFIERGRLPDRLRDATTELVVGALIAALVTYARRQHLQALRLAWTDALTGLPNRRAFERALPEAIAATEADGGVLTLAYLDFDDFHALNNRAGHDVGDAVLVAFADATRSALVARGAVVYRLGGDEFALLSTGSLSDCRDRIVAIESACRGVDPCWAEGAVRLSSGVLEWQPGWSAAEFLAATDRMMLLAKERRRAAAGR